MIVIIIIIIIVLIVRQGSFRIRSVRIIYIYMFLRICAAFKQRSIYPESICLRLYSLESKEIYTIY